jgi:thiamine-monophosphate kinase
MRCSTASRAWCAPPNLVDEFDLIKRLFAPLTGGRPEALGLTDDVALIPGPAGWQWAITKDAMVAGVHFFPDDPPELIARKLVRVNLSDLAAKGAEPQFLLLATCFPQGVEPAWLDRFASGLKIDCEGFKVAVIGGDTVASPGPLVLSLTAVGKVPEHTALLRSNARAGDHVWLSGTLGDSAFGLLVARGERKGLSDSDAGFLLDRYRLPQPRVALGARLRGLAHAAMDVSDGLLGDLGHICRASNLAAEIEAERLPLSAAARAALATGLGEGLITVTGGGDDYEILFTAPPDADRALSALSAELGLELTRIGRILPGQGVTLLDGGGRAMAVGRGGYRHFSGPSA